MHELYYEYNELCFPYLLFSNSLFASLDAIFDTCTHLYGSVEPKKIYEKYTPSHPKKLHPSQLIQLLSNFINKIRLCAYDKKIRENENNNQKNGANNAKMKIFEFKKTN